MTNAAIVVFCNKKDFFLTRICIASIRYYYPEIEIYLVKDYLNGDFSSQELEKAFNVKELSLGIRNFGWGTAKVHFILSNKLASKPVLILDSDIVFAGRFLENLFSFAKDYDFIVNPEEHNQPYSPFVKANYYDYKALNDIDPDFKFPGYFFNTGQMVVSTNKICSKEMLPYFDADKFPYCNRLDILPMPDQSLLNYFLPRKEQKGEIKLGKVSFMNWIGGGGVSGVDVKGIKDGNKYPFLIHWAGVLRIPYLSKMMLPEVLNFFEQEYYKNIPAGRLKRVLRKAYPVTSYKLKSIIKKSVSLKPFK